MKQPYHIHIQDSILKDLKIRLANTRWPDELANADWQLGTQEAYLKALCQYWQDGFDWKKQEQYLQSFPHYRSKVLDFNIHYIHQKGEGKTRAPLCLVHGYPDSFIRFLKIIPLLTKADQDGFSFDVVVPSIPGYGFSDRPTKPGMDPEQIADLFASLMTDELEYPAFFVHGGDWGSSISEQISINHPASLLGIHLTDIPFRHLLSPPMHNLTEAETKYLEQGKKWQQQEGAYANIQSTKPQTLAYGLNDSPAGLAAWIIEKFHSWSDCNGNIENCFTKDELLINLTIYWTTQTINSAIGIYYQTMQSMQQPSQTTANRIDVPTAIALFPKDLVNPPREYAERIFKIKQWTEMPKGGHFTAMEQPELLAEDIRKFAKKPGQTGPYSQAH